MYISKSLKICPFKEFLDELELLKKTDNRHRDRQRMIREWCHESQGSRYVKFEAKDSSDYDK